MELPGRAEVSRLAWQLRAARWGGRGGAGSLDPRYRGYATAPLAEVHGAFMECLRDLEGMATQRRLTLFEAFYGLAAPPADASPLAQHFGLTYDGVLAAVRAVETLVAERLPDRWGTQLERLQPATFDHRRPTAQAAISAAMSEAVGDKFTIAALNEMRVATDRVQPIASGILAESSRMARLRARRRSASLAGYHQQSIEAYRVRLRLVPTPRRFGVLSEGKDLELVLAAHRDILPTDLERAIYELTRRGGPNPELVGAIAANVNGALIILERDIEPLLSAITAQFKYGRRDLNSNRASALATVQAVRTALAREIEDLSSLHLADSVLRLVGPVHPLGQQAVREAVLTLRAHDLFPAAAAFLRELGTVAQSLPTSLDRDIAIGQLYSHKVGLALSIGRAHAYGTQPRLPADLTDLMRGTLKAASAIERHDTAGGNVGLVATLRRRAAELAFTWPDAPASHHVLPKVLEWAEEYSSATARLGQLQWCRTAMVVALRARNEGAFQRWEVQAEALAKDAPWHFTVMKEIADLRERASVLGFHSQVEQGRYPRLIAATAADLMRLERYTARPVRSGSKLLLVT